MLIRQENSQDFDAVYALVKAAFETAEHRDGNEQDLVNALRKSDAFIPELSLVAEQDGTIVGHILFTKAEIGGHPALILAPLSVLPECQKQGVGSALIREGHRIAKKLGYGYAVVLGSEHYYPRLGYAPSGQLGIEPPQGVPPVNFMAIKLREDAPPVNGAVRYAEEFGA